MRRSSGGADLALSVAAHVGRREAGRAVDTGVRCFADFDDFARELVDIVKDRFTARRKLDGSGLSGLIATANARIDAMAPFLRYDAVRPATRTRPKGEAHEILFVTSFGRSGVRSFKAFTAIRFHATRKRVVVDQETLGTAYTLHLLERAVERDLASRTERLRDLEVDLLSRAGLLTVWREAMRDDLVDPRRQFLLPSGAGLLFGHLEIVSAPSGAARVTIDEIGVRTFVAPLNDMRVVAHDVRGPCLLNYVARTAVSEDTLRPEQLAYLDDVVAFERRHAALLDRLAFHAHWTSPSLTMPVTRREVGQALTEAATDLGRLLRRHEMTFRLLEEIHHDGGPPAAGLEGIPADV